MKTQDAIKKTHGMKKIFDAIKKHCGFATDKQLYEHWGIPQSTFSSWKNRGKPTPEFIELIKKKHHDFNLDWILKGEGEMLVQQKELYHSEVKIGSDSLNIKLTGLTPDQVTATLQKILEAIRKE